MNQANAFANHSISSCNFFIGPAANPEFRTTEIYVSFIENADSEYSLRSNELENSEHSHSTAHFEESDGHNP